MYLPRWRGSGLSRRAELKCECRRDCEFQRECRCLRESGRESLPGHRISGQRATRATGRDIPVRHSGRQDVRNQCCRRGFSKNKGCFQGVFQQHHATVADRTADSFFKVADTARPDQDSFPDFLCRDQEHFRIYHSSGNAHQKRGASAQTAILDSSDPCTFPVVRNSRHDVYASRVAAF